MFQQGILSFNSFPRIFAAPLGLWYSFIQTFVIIIFIFKEKKKKKDIAHKQLYELCEYILYATILFLIERKGFSERKIEV